MRNLDGNILFAAHDLDRFLACSYGTLLDIRNLQEPLPKSQDDEQLQLLRVKGFEHERTWLEGLKQKRMSVVETLEARSLGERVDATLKAMAWGADIIYQAALLSGKWPGHADFLRRKGTGVNGPIYEVIDTNSWID